MFPKSHNTRAYRGQFNRNKQLAQIEENAERPVDEKEEKEEKENSRDRAPELPGGTQS